MKTTLIFFVVVFFHHILPAQVNCKLQGTIYKVQSSLGLVMRKEPTKEADKLYIVKNNRVVYADARTYGEDVIDGLQGHWVKAYYLDFEGYMFSGYLMKMKEIKASPDVTVVTDEKRSEEAGKYVITEESVFKKDSVLPGKRGFELDSIWPEFVTYEKKEQIEKGFFEDKEFVDYKNVDVPLGLNSKELYSSICRAKFDGFFRNNPDSVTFNMKEFFLIKVNAEGRVVDIQDERTETNNNSTLLAPGDVHQISKLEFSPALKDREKIKTLVPVGVETEVQRITYELKFKKNKVRWVKESYFIEPFPETNGHYSSIMERYKTEGKGKGKYKIVVQEVRISLSTYKRWEYNPFYYNQGYIHEERLVEFLIFEKY